MACSAMTCGDDRRTQWISWGRRTQAYAESDPSQYATSAVSAGISGKLPGELPTRTEELAGAARTAMRVFSISTWRSSSAMSASSCLARGSVEPE